MVPEDSNSGLHACVTTVVNSDFQPDFDTSKVHFGVCVGVFRILRALIQARDY